MEGFQELAALPGGAPHLPGLAEDDRPRHQGEEPQHREDGLGDRAGFTKEVEQPLLLERSRGLQEYEADQTHSRYRSPLALARDLAWRIRRGAPCRPPP